MKTVKPNYDKPNHCPECNRIPKASGTRSITLPYGEFCRGKTLSCYHCQVEWTIIKDRRVESDEEEKEETTLVNKVLIPSLLNKDGRYTEDALELETEAFNLLEPLKEQFSKKGYRSKEIASIILGAVEVLYNR